MAHENVQIKKNITRKIPVDMLTKYVPIFKFDCFDLVGGSRLNVAFSYQVQHQVICGMCLQIWVKVKIY